MLAIGTRAPAFTAQTTLGKIFFPKDYTGKHTVFIFYCMNNTPGWNRQLSSCKDDLEEFKKVNTAVLAFNPASVESHQSYAEKFQFNFPLVSDPDYSITKAYEALKPDGKGVIRTVYIVDKNGTVVYAKQGMPTDEDLLTEIRKTKVTL